MLKKAILLIVLLFVINKTKATVITVSNAPNSPAQFTDLQLAINAANNGDTIYVSGSLVNYGQITVNKQLILIGTGFNPQKDLPFVSQLISIDFQTGAEGSVIDGFIINNFGFLVPTCISFDFTAVYSSTCVNNIAVKKCKIQGYNSTTALHVGGSNWHIENNVIDRIDIVNQPSVIIKNNLITGYIINSNQPFVVITNNLFIDNPANGCFGFINNAEISNNIFYGASPVGASTSVFNNNLTFNTVQNSLPYGTNTGTGNITNLDPQFTSIQTVNYLFNVADNYILLPTSPGNNAGTDGTDIGPFGGFNPFPSSPIGGEPKIPQVKNMNINNTSLPLNGNLNINVKGKKQD
jgi:hypothetical protein